MGEENNIGGKVELDITDFKANIAQLNREIKVIESGFKATAAGMADWGNSVDGLESRITSLNQITDLQAQKIANLKAEYEKVAAAKGADSKAAQDLEIRINRETEAFNKNQIQLQQATQKLNSLSGEMQQVENETKQATKAIDGFGDGLETTGANLQQVGGDIVSTFGAMAAGIAASLGLAVKAVDDSSASLKKLESQTGATDTEMKELKTVLDDLYKQNYGESYDDLANSLATVKQVTGENGEELKKLTQNAIAVRDTFGFDVTESIRSAQSLIKQFGISGDEAYNLIVQGAQNGLNKNGDMLDTINEYAPQFKALGFNSDQFFNTILSGAEAGGWSIDKLGDAVKEFNIRAKDGSNTTAEGFQALGLNVKETEQSFAKGGQAGVDAFQKVIGELVKIEDPVKRNQIGVKLFGTQFEDLEFGAIASLGKVNGEIDKSNNSLNKLKDNRFGTLGAALSGLGRTISTDIVEPLGEQLIPVVESVIDDVKGLAAEFNNLSPAAKQVIAIGGVIVTVIAGIATAIGVIMSVIGSAVTGFGAISAAIAGAGGAAGIFGTVIAAITGPIGIAVAAIVGLIAIFTALYNNNETFRNSVLTIWEQIKLYFNTALVFISEIVKTVMTEVQSFFQEVLGRIRTFWDENGKAIMAIVKFALDNIKSYIEMVMGIIKGVFQMVWPIITGIIKVAWGGIQLVVKNGIDLVLGIIQTVLKLLQGDWSGAWETIKGTAKNIWKNIEQFFENVDLVQIGKDIIQGLIDGISSMANAVIKRAEDIANSIKDTIKGALDIHSPSRVMRDEVGKWIPEGISLGISDNLDAVISASNKMANAAIPNVAGTSTTSTTETINQYIMEKESVVIGAKDLKEMNDITDFFRTITQKGRAMGRVK